MKIADDDEIKHEKNENKFIVLFTFLLLIYDCSSLDQGMISREENGC